MVKEERAEALDRWIDQPDPGAPGDLVPLLDLAHDLKRRMAPAAATKAARARVWARLQREVRAARPRPGRRSGVLWLRPAYALAGVALAVSLGLGTTAAYASEGSLPGDLLYPVKRGLETARLALSPTPAGDAALLVSFADRRLAEIEALTAQGRWADVDAALASYPDAVVGLETADPAAVEAQLQHHVEVLERVRSQVPAAAQAGLEQALDRADRGRQEAKDRKDRKPKPEVPGRDKKNEATPEALESQDRHRNPRWPGGLPPGQQKKLTPTP